ncbi:MAG: hypothetical protein KDA71_06710, partial [Planctomycetales bacterium]|nr:hypothetical protein [Planctomycetales bacterium]
IEAVASQKIDSVVVAGAIGIAAGSQAGVAASGAGVYSLNKINTKVMAAINGDGSGIQADDVSVKANDASEIDADAVAVSIAAAFGSEVGAAISVGVSVALNEVTNDVDAFIQNADALAATGNVTVLSSIDPTPVSAADFDAATAGIQTLTAGQTVSHNGRIYRYRGFVADYAAEAGKVLLHKGNTVGVNLTDEDDSNDVIYRYWPAGSDNDEQEIDVSASNVLSGSDWVPVPTSELNRMNLGDAGQQNTLAVTDFANTKLWELADSTISARSAAASMAASFGGQTGLAVSGAGAVSRNVILTTSNALIDSSTIAGINIDLDSSNTSVITATVVSAAIAVGAGGTGGFGASIGLAIADNVIAGNENATDSAEVLASIRNSSIHATGHLTLDAVSSAKIDSVVLAGSVAVAVGGTGGVAISGAGVQAKNSVRTNVKAFIDGDGVTGPAAAAAIRAADVGIHSRDDSRIDAIGGALAIAAGLGVAGGGALSVGVAVAENRITNITESYVSGVDSVLETTGAGGAVDIDATSGGNIDATVASLSLAIGGGGAVGLAFSGSGAAARNIISNRTNAFISDNSIIDADGNIDLDASSNKQIDATTIAASAAAGVGGAAGIGASIGVALARNFIGWDPSTTSSDYDSTQSIGSLEKGKRVQIRGGVRDGDVYEYIGDAINETVNLAAQDFGNIDAWKLIIRSDPNDAGQ